MKPCIILLLLTIIASCSRNKFCTLSKNYLRTDVDTTKPYKLKGEYCIAGIRDTTIGDNIAAVSSKVFDRVNGRLMYNGVIWFYGSDTSSIILNKDTFEKVIKPGRYIIEAWHVGYIGTKTKKIDIKLNTKVDVNFYLGTVVEH